MAFLKYANAAIVQPVINQESWSEIRQAALGLGSSFEDRTAAHVVLQKYDPAQFLLSHCSIVASVDTENSGLPTGAQMFDGVQIERRFPDHYITVGTQKYINNNCFVPGTMVLMSDGTEKPIEQICIGDQVITHTGMCRVVTETFKRPYSGTLTVIKRLGDQRTLEVTPEHPIFAKVPATVCACGCGTPLKRRHYKAAVHRFKQFSQGHGQKRNQAPLPYNWVSAGFLEKGDFLSLPRLKGEEQTEVTPGKARLLGYYLAEGFFSRLKPTRKTNGKVTGQVSQLFLDSLGVNDKGNTPVAAVFALNLDETGTLAAEIQKLLMSEFGVGSNIQRVSENGISVTSRHSLELVQFLQEYTTAYSKTKKVSEKVLRWPLTLQRELVQAWIEGDGCVEGTAGGWVTAVSASPDLISQMHLILGRLGVFATRGVSITCGRKRVKVANGGIQIVSDPTKTCTVYKLQIGAYFASKLMGGSFLGPLFSRATSNLRKWGLSNRVESERTTFPIRSVTKRNYDGFVYNFETDTDHSYVANGVAVHNCDAFERKLLLATYKTFIGAENYMEHVQIPELSKGKIIDAAARDIGDSIYIDILVATDLKHKSLIEAISSQKLSTLSMGCQVTYTQCTKCGNIAEDELQICRHIKYEKGNWFIDASGKRRKIAELCGHHSDPGTVKFIEGSWVGTPAFTGAVLRNILDPANAMEGVLGKRIQVAFSQPARTADPGSLQRAAKLAPIGVGAKAVNADHLVSQYEGPSIGKLHATTPYSKDLQAAATLSARHQAVQGWRPRGGEQIYAVAAQQGEEPTPPAPVEDVDPLKKVEDELYNTLKKKVERRVRDDLNKEEASSVRKVLDENSSNESIIKSALRYPKWQRRAKAILASIPASKAKVILAGWILYDRGGWEAVVEANRFKGRDFLAVAHIVDRSTRKSNLSGGGRIYSTVIAVGGIRKYSDVNTYLAACRQVLGRTLLETEKVQLIEKGNLFSLGLSDFE